MKWIGVQLVAVFAVLFCGMRRSKYQSDYTIENAGQRPTPPPAPPRKR